MATYKDRGAGVNRRSSGGQAALSAWVFLDPLRTGLPPPGLALPQQGSIGIRPALLTGLVGGLLWCALLAAGYVMAGSSLPEFTQANIQQVSTIITILYALAALAQALIAVVAVGRAKRLRLVMGLLAAFAAGCVITLSLIVLLLLIGADASASWDLFSNVIGMGALLALPSVGVQSALLEWMRRVRSSRVQQLSPA